LRTRRAELEYAVLDAETPTITRKALDKVRRRVSDTIATGAPEAKRRRSRQPLPMFLTIWTAADRFVPGVTDFPS
jgi:hypothetical protein